ncbi:MAG: metal-dependent transcriptional regulator [Anaerolineales bacterium]|nr:metal-dependent transcriptional regulator [Anaerolineales bacterium]
MATTTVEAYLEIIFMMTAEGQSVIGARLAEALRVSRPTVTATLKRMVRDGFVKLDDHKEIELTPKGQAIAEHLQRRHRVVERWLTDVLEFDWAKSDAEAHKLEHAMSDEVFELLNKQLGYPTTCPHGNPIPGNARGSGDSKVIQLSAAREKERVTVVRISEYAENVGELLEYLGARGIVPGAPITVTEIAPLQGPLTLKLGSKVTSMSREVANFVWVKRAR